MPFTFLSCSTSKVKNKGPKDIMAVEDMNGEIRFSAHLPYPNSLSKLVQIYNLSQPTQQYNSFLAVTTFSFLHRLNECVYVHRPLLEPVESLLQMLLMWDPATRGGKLDPVTSKPSCFTALDNILNMKVRFLRENQSFESK